VRGDVPWCSACYARLDPDRPSTPVPRRIPPTRPAPRDVAARWTGASPDVEQVADRMLAELAACVDRPGWAERLPTARAGRAVLVAGLVTAVATVVLGAMALVGLAL
jgi:hypothetical protein